LKHEGTQDNPVQIDNEFNQQRCKTLDFLNTSFSGGGGDFALQETKAQFIHFVLFTLCWVLEAQISAKTMKQTNKEIYY
jgi:hypothetical protein